MKVSSRHIEYVEQRQNVRMWRVHSEEGEKMRSGYCELSTEEQVTEGLNSLWVALGNY